MATVTMKQPPIALPSLEASITPCAALSPVSQWHNPFELSQKDYSSPIPSFQRPNPRREEDLRQTRSYKPQETPYCGKSSKSTRYVSRKNLSADRIKHLERNRIAANKCRLKKKQENKELQNALDSVAAKRKNLLAEISMLKEDLWQLKNQLLEHAGSCNGQEIYQMLQNINQTAIQCPSPSFSISTMSDGLIEDKVSNSNSSAKSSSIISAESPEKLFDFFVNCPNL